MNEWSWVLVGFIALFILYAIYSDRRTKQRQAARIVEAEERRTSEEYVIDKQMKFEDRTSRAVEIGTPDVLNGRELYVYRRLMRDWFATLSAKGRYDEARLKRIRMDWLIYMETLEQRSTSRFLSMETEDEKRREVHERRFQEASIQLKAIEDAFAEAIGSDAVASLRQIRDKEFDSFSKSGELAPEGYRYRGYSPRGEPEQPVPR